MNGQCGRIVKLLKALLVIVVSDKMPVQAFEPTTSAILPYGQAVCPYVRLFRRYYPIKSPLPTSVEFLRPVYWKRTLTVLVIYPYGYTCIRTTVLSIFVLKLPRNQSVVYV